MRLAVVLLTALFAHAADIAVRREGPSFRISGAKDGAEIALYVGEGDVPPVLGRLERDGADFVFHPRFEIPNTVASRMVVGSAVFRFPATAPALPPSTVVERVYPTGSEIPANQLKFYVQFSAPMLAGEAWQNLRLLDDQGKTVELAFLEIEQELWDPDGKRLTVLFDPGRIKRGVLPRDEIGASLVAGRTYTLVADAAWRDARRVPLKEEFRKTFRVVAEDRTPIDPAKWRLTAPAAGSRDPLVVQFGEPLDAALALRLIQVAAPGRASLENGEREWRFVPDQPWSAGRQEIEIDTALEDLAGNKVGRPFDVDTFERITVRSGRGIVRLPFQPKGSATGSQ